MNYQLNTMLSRDIDWFISVNDLPIHVASFGSILPDAVNDRSKLRRIQKLVFDLPDLFEEGEIEFNDQYINQRMQLYKSQAEGNRHNYVESFLSFAKKGFVSMDRYIDEHMIQDIDNLQETPLFFIVCKPKTIKPLHIAHMLSIQSDIDITNFNQLIDFNQILNINTK